MKPGLLLKLYALLLLIIFGGVVLHAPLSVGFGTLFPGAALLIKSWKEILLLIATVLALSLLWQQKKWGTILNDRLLQVAAVYGALHLLTAAALLTGPTATLAGLAIDLRYILFFALVYILSVLAPEYRRRFLQVGAAGAAVVIGFGALQLFLPADILTHIGYGDTTIQPYMTVDENPEYIRINSTLRGPNPLGAYIVVFIGLAVSFVVRKKAHLQEPKLALLAGAIAVSTAAVLWATFSRSAVAAAGLTVAMLMMVAGRGWFSRWVWITGCIVVFALVGGIFAGRNSAFIENVILHENDGSGGMVSSNEEHVSSLKEGTERMLRQPVGAGVGSTGSASLMTDSPLIIENQYLFIAHEVGWFGLGLFITLVCLVLTCLWQQRHDWLSLGVFASGVALSLVGLLLPVWADDTVAMVWWGLAGLAVSTGGEYVRK